MLIDATVIKLNRKGAGIGPEYDLIIYGHGKVVFDGKENVSKIGIAEGRIEEDQVVDLLNEFKKSDFFKLEDKYASEETIGKQYTTISISIPKESGEAVTKSITYYQGALNIPIELKSLVNKIEEIVNVDKWVIEPVHVEEIDDEPISVPIEEIKEEPIPEPIEKKPIVTKTIPMKKAKTKKPVKLIAGAVVIVLIIALLSFAVFAGIIDLSFTDDTDESSEAVLKIPYITTATYVSSLGSYQQYIENEFKQEETIYVYCEYENVTALNGTDCDIRYEITFSNRETEVHFDVFSEFDLKNFSRYSIASESTWPVGEYEITLVLYDFETMKSTTATTNFTLTEKSLRISELNPASEIRGIDDYDEKTIFTQGDTLYIYEEYQGFATNDEGDCDTYLELNVEKIVGDKNLTINANVIDSSLKGREWHFDIDDTWPTGSYTVTSSIIDSISSEWDVKFTGFSII